MLFSLIILWIFTLMVAFSVLALGRVCLQFNTALHDLKSELRGRFEKVVGSHIPSFSVTTIDGRSRFTDNDIHNHPTLLVFLSPTCTHCHVVIEQLIAASQAWHTSGGLLLGVSNGDSEQMMKFSTRSGANFPILAQDKWELAELFQINATPWGVAIAPSGIVTASGVLGTPEQLQALMEATKSLSPIY